MKPHFKYSKQQRNGVLFLIAIIAILQLLFHFIDFSGETPIINDKELEAYRKEIDSLLLVEIEKNKPKIFPFNPNFITDYKGYTLGMSIEEIDRLHQFRKQDKWINSASQFQKITKVSDSLFNKIKPYFKFPDWVTNPKPRQKHTTNFKNSKPKTISEKIDLNKATVKQLQRVIGIGEKLSERIVKYRTRQNGYIADIELSEVYGLKPEVIVRVKNHFTVKTPKAVSKINLNTATRDELVTIPYLDYVNVKHILEERTLREGFKSFDELIKIEEFPVNKLEIIKLYLHL